MTIKRLFLILAICILCTGIAACTVFPRNGAVTFPDHPQTGSKTGKRSETNGVALEINRGVYALSAHFPGFSQAYASNFFGYRLGELSLNLTIYEKETDASVVHPGGLAAYEKRSENGMEYYFRTDEVFWDGMDEAGNHIGGRTTNAELIGYLDDYLVVLSGSSERGDVSAVTPALLGELLRQNEIPGLIQTERCANARFYDGLRECNVSLVDRESPAYAQLMAQQGTVVQTQEHIKYRASPKNRLPEDPNSRVILCETDWGALVISCGVPYCERNTIAAEQLDFVNFSLAKEVAGSLGVTLGNIEEQAGA